MIWLLLAVLAIAVVTGWALRRDLARAACRDYWGADDYQSDYCRPNDWQPVTSFSITFVPVTSERHEALSFRTPIPLRSGDEVLLSTDRSDPMPVYRYDQDGKPWLIAIGSEELKP